eukprot:TRINITY_DN735_c0_g1_i1.p1 TRINITY_DN735_c0_g1~~TRINITY_DN735_c0_g1_i1.p1  ORF type:complete len:116 (-),score=59.06 TRINITY_DN735_c0_g1_i1:106-453(-)
MAKRKVYIGGLDELVTEEILKAAFSPFGEILDVQIPRDLTTDRSKGFGFVEYELNEDAAAALDNMHNSELFGKTIKCNLATLQPVKTKAVWDEDEWHVDRLNQNENNNDSSENES